MAKNEGSEYKYQNSYPSSATYYEVVLDWTLNLSEPPKVRYTASNILSIQ